MTKEELALEVIDRLKKEYPDAGCTAGLQSGVEAAGQCPSGGAVYRCACQCGRLRDCLRNIQMWRHWRMPRWKTSRRL